MHEPAFPHFPNTQRVSLNLHQDRRSTRNVTPARLLPWHIANDISVKVDSVDKVLGNYRYRPTRCLGVGMDSINAILCITVLANLLASRISQTKHIVG